MTYTKNFCFTCTRFLAMVVSGDGCGGSYPCGDTSSKKQIAAFARISKWVGLMM
jgi:hypothetical protein